MARRLVRVIDPAKGVAERRDTSSVYVIDLRELLGNGKARARAMSREAFETGALAQLPPGDSTGLPARMARLCPRSPSKQARMAELQVMRPQAARPSSYCTERHGAGPARRRASI